MKTIILGTSGHIDHGKTSLVKALTGIDTDRLKEEKQRGITIELGFASLKIDKETQVGIVDVPGHERFVRHMVAGASGMDIVCMIIAADEGVMPQTREHLDICQLLDVKHGMIVVTKVDLVDNEFLELVIDDINDSVKGSFLENAPIVTCSSETHEGIDDVRSCIGRLCQQIQSKNPANLFRLPIDRVFSMKGFGAVVTGTQLSGQVSVGDPVMIYPSKKAARVRGLQNHQNKIQTSFSGMRCAINLQGIDRGDIHRGDILSHPDCLQPTYMIDVHFQYLDINDRPLEFRSKVRFHTGTSEIPAHIILLDQDQLLPGETTFAQIRLETPLCVMRNDRFVLRHFSPVQTIGGGVIIHPLAPKRKRFKNEIIGDMKLLGLADDMNCLIIHIQRAGYSGITLKRLKQCTAIDDHTMEKHLNHLIDSHVIFVLDSDTKKYLHQATIDHWKGIICIKLKQYHKDMPHRTGMPRQELKSRLPGVFPPALFQRLIDELIGSNAIETHQEVVCIKNHCPRLSSQMDQMKEAVYQITQKSGLGPPLVKELAQHFGKNTQEIETLLAFLENEGKIVRITQDMGVCLNVLNDLQTKLIDYLKKNDTITTKEFKKSGQCFPKICHSAH
ncbi:MAG: Selenocysteine-specific elongation factor [Candidatus Magnetoglobus multicellularis str. Araruama]|uniref:Selenocysteine-specific elongation factor n=1 Tax=Candidatus Magnetoglobus multicellularis str. Araruama TaxID=890399 RepID=A0A1V1PDS4_9BACT|nr:MAG: Selenocysteine-specific elongation factor [Candidatus Magnetoglobus multicellularis str. Araruama]